MKAHRSVLSGSFFPEYLVVVVSQSTAGDAL